eukprot:TRINITY_DN21352_c0_g1_i1.p1 TRINITY_DN21352_c0_g1~~TRINITY_DN21352_c0_g1_i1.p1  ORF type:complete len:837 (+),score=171.94 TRINITY_DN21352_c0_g1_i1:75-2585(+)
METELQHLAGREVRIRDLRSKLVNGIHDGCLDLDAATTDGDGELAERSSREIAFEGVELPESITEVTELLLKQAELKQLELSVSRDDNNSVLNIISDLCHDLNTPIPTNNNILEQVINSSHNLSDLCNSDVSAATNQLLGQLRASAPTIDYFHKISNDHLKGYNNSKATGEFAVADQHLGDHSDVLAELNNLFQERIGLAMDSGSQDEQFLAKVDMQKNKFSAAVRDLRTEFESKTLQLAEDKEKVGASREQHLQLAENSLQGLNADLDENCSKIAENTTQHQQVLSDLNLLARKLTEIGDERSTLVERHLGLKKELSIIMTQTQAIQKLHDNHESLLDHLKSKVVTVIENIKELHQHGNTKVETIKATITSNNDKVTSALANEQQGHYDCFQELYNSLKLRLFTLRNRSEELQDASKAAHWRMTVSQNTLDHAGVTGCMSNIKEISSLKEDVMAASAQVVAKLQRCVSDVRQSLSSGPGAGLSDDVNAYITKTDSEYEKKASKILKDRAEALAANEGVGSQLSLEPHSPSLPAIERSRDDRMRAAMHSERLQNFIVSPNEKGTPRSPLTQPHAVQPYEGVGSPRRVKAEEGTERDKTNGFKFKPYAAIRSRSRDPEDYRESSYPAADMRPSRESTFSTPREMSNSYRSGPQIASPRSPTPREIAEYHYRHVREPSHSMDRNVSGSQHSPDVVPNTRNQYSQPRESSHRSLSHQPVSTAGVEHFDGTPASPEFRYKSAEEDVAQRDQQPSEPPVGYLGRKAEGPSYSRAAVTSAPRQPSSERSPSISKISLSMANCEDLRRRAEQLRKAAEETRRRAQAHRDQASAISPRRPHVSN